MQVIAKSIKVLKTGENDYGEWNLVSIVTSDDVKYTTLAKGAEAIEPGSLLDISIMDEDEKGKKFKKYKVLEEGRKPSPPGNGDGMTPDMWDEKDRIHRESIESQTAFKGIVELMAAKVIKPENDLGSAALDWAMVRLATHQPSPQPLSTESSTTEEGTKGKTLSKKSAKILNDTALEKEYDPSNVTAIIISEFHKGKASELTDAESVDLVNMLIAGKFKQQIREKTLKEEADSNEPENLPF